jgi:uridine phosphorylase
MKPSDENDPILTAKELLAYRRANGALPDFSPPRAVIFAPQKSLASYVLRKHATKQIKGFLGEFHLLKHTKGEIAISTGFGIGAPVVAGLADEFVALGVTQFALIGMAGALQSNLQTGSLILSTGAIRGEGVSLHYLPPAEIVESSSVMTQGLSAILTQKNSVHSSGITWTTDAPFRELRKDVLDYQNRGILAVDMEAAAMLAVAKANERPALAAFSMADTLANGKWSMPQDLHLAQLGLITLFESLLSYLLSP